MSKFTTNSNAGAFPVSENDCGGLTKLEYFTAAALTGLLAGGGYNLEAASVKAVVLAEKTIQALNAVE